MSRRHHTSCEAADGPLRLYVWRDDDYPLDALHMIALAKSLDQARSIVVSSIPSHLRYRLSGLATDPEVYDAPTGVFL